MRTFEERKEEILRRSHTRVQQKKRRRRIGGTLCTVLVVGGIALWASSSIKPQNANTLTIAPDILIDTDLTYGEGERNALYGNPITAPLVTVRHNEEMRIYNRSESVEHITALLEQALDSAQYTGDTDVSLSRPSEEPYILTVVSANGEMAVYRLTGTVLIETTTSTAYVLTDEAYDQLSQALELH